MTNAIPQLPVHNIRRPYEEKLNVKRLEDLKTVQSWRRGSKRVLTISGPPAQGKSWFLSHFYHLLREEGVPAFFVDITEFLLPGTLGSREIDSVALQHWLIEFANTLRKECPETPATHEVSAIESNLRTLAARVGLRCWPDQSIFLFIDGGDEPSREAFKTIERRLLEPILTAHGSWHFIVALRQEQRLTSYMLRQSQLDMKLGVFDAPSEAVSQKGHQQIAKLIAADEAVDLPSIDDILSAVPGYTWTHPGLNHFLFLEIKANRFLDQSNWLSPDYRIKALKSITMLPDPQVNELYNWLIELAIHLDKQSIIEEWSKQTGLAISELWQRLEILQNAQLIKVIRPNRYSLPDGLREFIRGSRSIIEIRIDADFDDWQTTKEHQQLFLSRLSEHLSLNPKRIQLLTVNKGSVIITMEVDDGVANELVDAVQQGLFPDWRIISIVHNDFVSYLVRHYNNDDLHHLCYRLKIDYEELPGETISRKALEIIKHCERHSRFSALIQECKYMRPHLPVPSVTNEES